VIFAWDEANRGHIAKHDVAPIEAQFVVENATPPFPQMAPEGKRLVWGPTAAGRLLQVIYVLKEQDEVAFESVETLDWARLQDMPQAKVVYVVHAMDLTRDMKRRLRRRRR
jgi:uncharacterized DUF497 family protein